MPTLISSLAEDTNPSQSSLVPILVSGIIRKTFLSNVINLVTGGTVTSVSAGTNISIATQGSPTQQLTVSFSLPGMIVPYSGVDSTVPSGWLFCNGQAISRSTYASLFSVIATTYGVGDGSSTFNVPDLRGRIPFGPAQSSSDSSPLNGASFNSGNFYSLASSGGSENHLITSQQTPAKSHTHTASGSMSVCGNRNDTANWDDPDCRPPENYSDFANLGEVAPGNQKTISSSATTSNLAGIDASLSHSNMPPVIMMSYLIKV